MLERSFFGKTIVKNVAIRQFKVSLSVLIFVWAVNHVKTDQLSQKLDVFFMEVTLDYASKIENLCEILFTEPHQKLEFMFIHR